MAIRVPTFEEIGQRLTMLAEERNYKPYDVWQHCPELSRATVYNAMHGEPMSVETLLCISRAIEVSMKEIFDFDDHGMHLTNEEEYFIEIIRKLDDQKFQRLIGYLHSLDETKE